MQYCVKSHARCLCIFYDIHSQQFHEGPSTVIPIYRKTEAQNYLVTFLRPNVNKCQGQKFPPKDMPWCFLIIHCAEHLVSPFNLEMHALKKKKYKITSKDLLYSTGNYTQYVAISYNGECKTM